MEMQKYGCMLKTSSFGAILLAYDIITHEGAQNEPNLPLCPPATGQESSDDSEGIFVITNAYVATFISNIRSLVLDRLTDE